MHHWLGLLAGSITIGACLVGTLVAPRRSQLIPLIGVAAGAYLMIRSFSAIVLTGDAEAIGLAIFFVAAGLAGGYWCAAAALPHAVVDSPRQAAAHMQGSQPRDKPALVILSCAEAPRYRIASTARVIERLVSSGALQLPTSAMPFVFLSEKTRYRALGGFNPARATVTGVADQVAEALSDRVGQTTVAWCDGSPSLGSAVRDLAAAGHREVVVVTLGPDDSFATMDARRTAQSVADETGVRLSVAPSIWRSDDLAARLVDRIIETAHGQELGSVGVVLVGEGQPTAWSSLECGWTEVENYFTQRVRMMLVERGFAESTIRASWIEWQTPDVTETVRHLAALGCQHVIIAPATLPHLTLASALDLKHAVESARLDDTVRVVTLSPWGDDPAIVGTVTQAADAALDLLSD